ncbi:MAG: rhomboid family intramembrane serine protease [Bacteroidia bacterium]
MSFTDRIKYEYTKGNSAIRQIIMINLGVFVISLLINLFGQLMQVNPANFFSYFYLPSDLGTLVLRPWTFLTNIFFHSMSSMWHILGNMIMLYFIGRILQDFLDRSKVWTIFLGGGLVGGLFFVVMANVFPLFSDVVSRMVLLGASGGVTAIIVATGVHLPYYEVRPFGVFRIQMRWLAAILVLLDLLNMPASANFGGLFAHLGGALFGALYILNLQGRINIPSFELPSFKRSKMKTVYRDEGKRQVRANLRKSKPDQQQIDAILDKISQSGYDSLSQEEKEILFKASDS